jgi:hypothetical protein
MVMVEINTSEQTTAACVPPTNLHSHPIMVTFSFSMGHRSDHFATFLVKMLVIAVMALVETSTSPKQMEDFTLTSLLLPIRRHSLNNSELDGIDSPQIKTTLNVQREA